MTLIIEPADVGRHRAAATLSVSEFFELVSLEKSADEVSIEGVRYRPHQNGGGLVAQTAFVGADVYVDKHAQVLDNAIIVGNAQLLDRAIVRDNATIEGRCQLAGESIVEGFATLFGMVTLRRHARVGGTARLEGGVLLDAYTSITRGHLVGPLVVG